MKQILVVEDNTPLRALWTEALTLAGYRVVPAATAAEAFSRLPALEPDLILLDLVMPSRQIDGIELLARLHETPAWTNIPVLIVSGIGESVDRRGAAALGVRNILTKPVELRTLLGEIERLTGPRPAPRSPTPLRPDSAGPHARVTNPNREQRRSH